jgi:hypothetical protein
MIMRLRNRRPRPGKNPGKRSSKTKVTAKSERVVVDEVFDDGTVRLLRAKWIGNRADNDLSINTWKDEREDFMDARLVEAFVGFPPQRSLQEGDVFFIVDGSKLNNKYKPIPSERARSIHLLRSWDESRELARSDIKKEFSKLSAIKISTGDKKEINGLYRRVDEKFKKA